MELSTSVFQLLRKEKKHASRNNTIDTDPGGIPSLVGKSLHPDGWQHQVDSERGGRHRRGAVAAERIWTVSLFLTHSCSDLSGLARMQVMATASREFQSTIRADRAAIEQKSRAHRW